MTTIEQIDTVTGELVLATDRTLFRTDDPVEVLQAARTVADALKGALDAGGMVQKIGKTEHVKIDGWQTLGSMLGISPYVVWSRPCEDGWEARAEARTTDGRIVGAAEAMCTRTESNWQRRDEYALRSMAQTRAMSKALKGPLGFIVTLAGKSATPAEEAETDQPPYGPAATPKQRVTTAKALIALHGPGYDPDPVLERIETDAGGYLPRVAARAVMLAAALRPGGGRTGAGTSGVRGTEDATPGGDTPTGEVTGENYGEERAP